MSAISLIRRIVNHHPLKPETFRTGEKKTGMDEPLILKMNPQNVVGCLIIIFCVTVSGAWYRRRSALSDGRGGFGKSWHSQGF